MERKFFTIFRFGLLAMYLSLAATSAFAAPVKGAVTSLHDDKSKKEKKAKDGKDAGEIKDDKEQKVPAEQNYDRYDKRKKRVNRPMRC